MTSAFNDDNRSADNPDASGGTGGTGNSNEFVNSNAGGGLQYRCGCGFDVSITPGVEVCPNCKQKLPNNLGTDPTLTLSFCSPRLDAGPRLESSLGGGRDLDLTSDLQTNPGSATPVRGNLWRQPLASRTGQRLGHFVLQEPLGEGGMGAVYRALDTSLQRYVAVKVLRDGGEGSTGPNSRQSDRRRHTDRLRREAVSQARLNHPRVVTIYYVGREGEDPFLAMELLPGPTLQQRLTDGPVAYDELIEYALQITDALEAADRSGMVHGDIKPSNLLMAGPGNIKLSDFGLARRSGSTSDDGGISGTPNYLAPELLDGAAPDRRADMYAFGITLFELAFGRRPFELSGDTLGEQLSAHRTAEIEFPQKWPAEIPEPFRAILQRLLAKDPKDRYDSYAELRADLKTVRPIGSTLAGRPARLIAWVIDAFLLALLQVPFLVPNFLARNVFENGGTIWFDNNVPIISYGMIEFALSILAYAGWILVPLISLWWDLKRYRTPGRYLMQLRVVDKYGLPPSRRILITRNVLRYFNFWAGVIFGLPTAFGLIVFGIIDDVLGQLWILVDGILIFGSLRRTIHDRICDTHVVLDERSNHQATSRVSPGTTIHTS